MQNESYSFMQGVDSSGDSAKTDTRSSSIDQLQHLEQDNARLRAIVAELLLKNQMLRWQLADRGSPEMLLALEAEADS